MKKYFVLLLFWVNMVVGQNTINHYKYIIVPSQFSFLQEKNEYKLNTLTKLLFEKYGFIVFFDNEELPSEILNSNCDKLYADLISTGNFTRTKLQVVLKDCKKNIVYQTVVGISKDKVYKVAYTQALRDAFRSFDTLHYRYAPNGQQNEIGKIAAPANTAVILTETFEQTSETLYAQPISSGFQLVDATPQVVMKIYKTSSPSTYSAVKGTTQGILLLKDNQWFFEYYQNDTLVSEKVNVKF